MKSTIFELSENYRTLFQAMCDDESDVLTQLAFQMSQTELEEKLEAYTVMIKTFTGNITTRQKEIEELQAKNAKELKSLTYLQSVLQQTVKEFGKKDTTATNMDTFELKAGHLKINCVPSRSIQVEETFVDPQYGSFKAELVNLSQEQLNTVRLALHNKPFKFGFTPDKKAIKDALDRGIQIEGASFNINYNLKVGLL